MNEDYFDSVFVLVFPVEGQIDFLVPGSCNCLGRLVVLKVFQSVYAFCLQSFLLSLYSIIPFVSSEDSGP